MKRFTSSPEPLRFTLDGSADLEWHLARTSERVLAGVRRVIPDHRLEGLLLGGGYGRGEGGVLITTMGHRPYNDLEFYVFLRGNRLLNRARHQRALHDLARRLHTEAEVEVEFHITSLETLRQSPVSMFHYDLVTGHRWLKGNETLLDGCEHHREADRIPLSEATRLLMNRCSGLLFALESLQHQPFTAEDADFVGRNLAKARLALGDAVLVHNRLYHWSCRERHARLQRLTAHTDMPWLEDVRRHHAAGVEFKLHPSRSAVPHAELEDQYEELASLARRIFLWLESGRLRCRFDTARDYAFHKLDKCPEMPAWRNRLVNAFSMGWFASLSPSAGRHPRDRLLRALPLLLFEPLEEPGVLPAIQRELRTAVTTFPELTWAYRHLWQRFN